MPTHSSSVCVLTYVRSRAIVMKVIGRTGSRGQVSTGGFDVRESNCFANLAFVVVSEVRTENVQ